MVSQAVDIVTVGVSSDPSQATLDAIIEGVEGDFNERTHHSWGVLTQVVETHDLKHGDYEWGRGLPIHLNHRDTQTIDSGEGDKVELWDGTNWDNITASQGTSWKQLEGLGKFYLLGQHFSIFREDRLRVTYRYGTLTVPKGIKNVILKKCVVTLLEKSFAMSNIQFNSDRGLRTKELVDKWNEEYDDYIFRWQDIVNVEY